MLTTSIIAVVASILISRRRKPNVKKNKSTLSNNHRLKRPLETKSTAKEVAINERDKVNNRYFGISLLSLGCVSVGVFYPILRVVSVAGLIYVSIPFYKNAYISLVNEKKLGINVLDAIIVTASIKMGYYFFWSIVCSFVYGSQKLLNKTEDTSRKSLAGIFGEKSHFVYVLQEGIEIEVPLEALKLEDIVVVVSGETIPIDGKITEGIASIDQHALTGETQPIEKSVGDEVFSSTVVLNGRVCIKVEKTGEETTMAKIVEILNQQSDLKSSIQSRGERYSDRSVLPTLSASTLALFTMGPVAATTILNASFAYPLRVLAPIGMLNFMKTSSRKGILIKNGHVLDFLNKIDTVVFDKTGTLTHEQPHVRNVYTCLNYNMDTVLGYAATAEYKQTHPVAAAILAEAEKRGIVLPEINESEYKVGYGITVTLDDKQTPQEKKTIYVGSARFIEMEGIHIPHEIHEAQAACHQKGHSLVMVAINDQLVGAIELLPTTRPEAKAIINWLKAANKSIYIISGDHEMPTKRLAQELGITHYFAETLPNNKAEIIEDLQNQGRFVCYVGDGINDAIALKKAHVSVSLQGASAIATDAAQVILMDGSLKQLSLLFELSKQYENRMKSMLTSTMVPGFIVVVGVFFFHFGLIHSSIINQTGFAAGFLNAMKPFKKKKLLSSDNSTTTS